MIFNKRILLGISILFSFAGLIFVCIATAGSTSNYKPITNVYFGDASISHINVSKVIPVFTPVLEVLGAALLAPGVDKDLVFSAMRNISQTSVLLPFLTLLINCENTTTALNSIMNLTPLVVTSQQGNTKTELQGFNSLLSTSKNSNNTVEYLQTLLNQVLDYNSTQMVELEDTAFTLLRDSSNPTNTTGSLKTLSGLTIADMVPLEPAFELLQNSNNATASFLGLVTLMNATIPTATAETLFATLQSAIDSGSNITTLFTRLSSSLPSDLAASGLALENILTSAKNTNSTLGYLNSILKANLTSSTTAKKVLSTITDLYNNAHNKTLLLSSLTSLVSAVGNTNVTNELTTLYDILDNSNDASSNVDTLETLQHILITDTSNNQYIPYLFNILKTSKDPAASFSALLNVTSYAVSNLAEFTPLLSLLKNASSTSIPTNEQLYNITPMVLEELEIPSAFRLSIFTLCYINSEGKVTNCSKSHAVQNMDFRSIIYNSLIKSEFEPYLKALNITADDLYLQGQLLKKEHMYVPAIRAVLSFNILFIVSSFFILCAFIYMFIKHNEFALSHKGWFGLLLLSLFCSLFSGISSTIVACMITIIKSGTYKDGFNVVYTTGSAYSGLSWCAFSISFITSMIVGIMWLNHWRGAHHGISPLVEKETITMEASTETASDVSSKVSKDQVIATEQKV